MPSNVVILPVEQVSDGNNARPTSSKEMRRNDNYFLEKIAERWMNDTKQSRPGLTYRLERLPFGYRGFEHHRQGTKHIDRYLYGHPNGIFRSLNELYPHFKHLQDHQDPAGCTCKLCSKTTSGSVSSAGSPRRASDFSPAVASVVRKPTSTKVKLLQRSSDRLPEGRLSSSPFDNGLRREQVDEEGTPDVYRILIDKLQAAGSENAVDEDFADQLSPDWRVGHNILQGLMTEWQELPKYVPRLGEVVLFTRSYNAGISWDAASRMFYHPSTRHPINWEAAVVTQTPTESLSKEDLCGVPSNKKHNVTYSGFRLEPLSEVGNEYKPFTTQHKYVPLHAVRPFSMWKDCMLTDRTEAWHPTIKHALAVASSFCILGKYRFKGTWPEATLFVKSVYIGPELIMIGDIVKLASIDKKSKVTDVMLVTSIRLRFVNLDRASNDDYDGGLPYTTVLHFGGKAVTLDPKRSFAGIAKTPIKPGRHSLPDGLAAYGQWFHMVDPAHEKARLEIPFHRVLGRCHVETAMRAWYATAGEIEPGGKLLDLSQGITDVEEARSFSVNNDPRILSGKSWFWADSRIEQLDLHEVNSKFVGPKDESRTSKQVNAWRQALKVLDGKRGSVEQYYNAQVKRQEEEKMNIPVSSFGMMGAVREEGDGGPDVERGVASAMDIDDDEADVVQTGKVIINLVDDDDDDDDDDDFDKTIDDQGY